MHLWHSSSEEPLLAHQLDELFICYNPLTGQTHLLNALPFEVLNLLQEAPRSVEEIVLEISQLTAGLDVEISDNAIISTLEQLKNEELVY